MFKMPLHEIWIRFYTTDITLTLEILKENLNISSYILDSLGKMAAILVNCDHNTLIDKTHLLVDTEATILVSGKI
jgi:hypothetical protein